MMKAKMYLIYINSSIFVGSVTVSVNPLYYTSSCNYLIKYYLNNYKDLPLVINTHGWIKGLGLNATEGYLQNLPELNVIQVYNILLIVTR